MVLGVRGRKAKKKHFISLSVSSTERLDVTFYYIKYVRKRIGSYFLFTTLQVTVKGLGEMIQNKWLCKDVRILANSRWRVDNYRPAVTYLAPCAQCFTR